MARILIVDDSPAQICNLKKMIEDWGHEAISAENGEQALQLARQEQPDIILMDVIMPGMNGFQATRKLSKDKTTHNIPVIFVTKKDDETDRIWGLRQGATAFLTKPVNPQELLTAISSAINAITA